MWDLWWTLGQIFLLMLRFPPVNFIPPMLSTHLRQDVAVTKRTCVQSLERSKKQCRLGNRRVLNRKLLSIFFALSGGLWMLVLFKICSASSMFICMHQTMDWSSRGEGNRWFRPLCTRSKIDNEGSCVTRRRSGGSELAVCRKNFQTSFLKYLCLVFRVAAGDFSNWKAG